VAMAEAKQLIEEVSNKPIDDHLIGLTCERISSIRISPEAQEGLSAFLEKREPAWKVEPSAGESHD
nr:gamma-carboxygeranoyl-CoA hydratase [Endozoicomonas sp.]